MKWLLESNRLKHLLYAIPCGMLLSILFVLGLALGMEFKDKQHSNELDWKDVAATMIGGAIGQLITIIIYLL